MKNITASTTAIVVAPLVYLPIGLAVTIFFGLLDVFPFEPYNDVPISDTIVPDLFIGGLVGATTMLIVGKVFARFGWVFDRVKVVIVTVALWTSLFVVVMSVLPVNVETVMRGVAFLVTFAVGLRYIDAE